MFDVGFSELLVIAVVALLVLGPERLPKAARFAGLWVRRARAQWHSVKSELERELADDELRRTLRDTQAALRDARASLHDAGTDARHAIRDGSVDLMRGPRPMAPDSTTDLQATAAASDHAGPGDVHAPVTHAIPPPRPVDDADPGR